MHGQPFSSAIVLVVEDEPALRGLICTALARAGYGVLEARNGREALALADQLPIDLMILDLRLPYIGGEEVIARLRERLPALRILSMSGYPLNPSADVEVPFLAKPFSRDRLLENVRALLPRGLNTPACPAGGGGQ